MMETSPQNKSLVSIIIFLLFTNIAMLIFFLFLGNSRRPEHGHDENYMSNVLKKEVGFSDNQLEAYKKLKDEQMPKMKPLFEEVRSTKDSFYRLLYVNPLPDSTLAASASNIGKKQVALDMQMFQNLKNIRNLCTPEQLPKFDSSIKVVIARITGRGRRPGGSETHGNEIHDTEKH